MDGTRTALLPRPVPSGSPATGGSRAADQYCWPARDRGL